MNEFPYDESIVLHFANNSRYFYRWEEEMIILVIDLSADRERERKKRIIATF